MATKVIYIPCVIQIHYSQPFMFLLLLHIKITTSKFWNHRLKLRHIRPIFLKKEDDGFLLTCLYINIIKVAPIISNDRLIPIW